MTPAPDPGTSARHRRVAPGAADLIALLGRLGAGPGLDAAVVEELRRSVDGLAADVLAVEQRAARLDERVLRLAQDAQRYRTLFDHADAQVVTDEHGTVRELNVAAARLLGVEPGFASGKPLAAFVALPDRRRVRGAVSERRPTGERRGLRVSLVGRDRRVVPVDVEVHALDPDVGTGGVPLCWTLVDRTETDRVSRLAEANRELAVSDEAHHGALAVLGEVFRPACPAAPGVDLGVQYLPASPDAPTGGDLYDWLVLADGDVHLAVVDATGHGIATTRQALAAVHVLRVLALTGLPADDLVERARPVIGAMPDKLVASALVARYRPTTGDLRVAVAGHPAPLVVRGDGTVEELVTAGTLLGIPARLARDPVVATTRLEVGDVLVAYTDGLVEAGRDPDGGVERLRSAVTQASGLSAAGAARQIVCDVLADRDRDDDTLALVLRRVDPVDRSGTPALVHHVGPEPRAAAGLRAELAPLLADLEATQAADVLLVVSEIVAAASAVGALGVDVELRRAGDLVVLDAAVAGEGVGWTGQLGDHVDPDRVQGLGLAAAVSSAFSVRVDGLRSSVHALIGSIESPLGATPAPPGPSA